MRLHCYYRQFSGRVDHSINFISVIFALVHAFVSSRLDYCNSLLYGVSDELLQKLRSERGRTSCDGTKEIRPSRCFTNFTGCPSANALWSSTSVSMCWRHRIWLTTVYWSLLWPADGTWDGQIPGSWSFAEHELYWQFGARDFAVSCAVIWNSLPIDLRVPSLSAATFARHTKACLFRRPS